MKQIVTSMMAVAGVAMAVQAQTLNMTQLANIDLIDITGNSASAKYIGTTPTAVAWNGTEAYIAGWNNTGAAQNTGIAKVTGIYAPVSTFSNAFDQRLTPAFRGNLDLARKGDQLYSAAEYGGAVADNGIRQFDISGAPTQTSAFLNGGYRASGLDVDSRTGNIASVSVATGLRQFVLNDATTVATQIYGPFATTGYSTLVGTDANTNWRDVQVDPMTGDVYFRKQNHIWKSVRSGDNAGTQMATQFITLTVGDQAGQNMDFAYGTADGDFIIANSRSSGATGQSFASILKAFNLDGTAASINLIGYTGPATGIGWYDFDYDAATKTLAILDSGNKRLYIFGVPTPGTAGLLGLAGLAGLRRRR
jgi:hypothetical protein